MLHFHRKHTFVHHLVNSGISGTEIKIDYKVVLNKNITFLLLQFRIHKLPQKFVHILVTFKQLTHSRTEVRFVQ